MRPLRVFIPPSSIDARLGVGTIGGVQGFIGILVWILIYIVGLGLLMVLCEWLGRLYANWGGRRFMERRREAEVGQLKDENRKLKSELVAAMSGEERIFGSREGKVRHMKGGEAVRFERYFNFIYGKDPEKLRILHMDDLGGFIEIFQNGTWGDPGFDVPLRERTWHIVGDELYMITHGQQYFSKAEEDIIEIRRIEYNGDLSLTERFEGKSRVECGVDTLCKHRGGGRRRASGAVADY
jgi:hypothetical protein